MTHNIRIGNQTAFSASDSMDPLKFAIDQGFDAFEWFADKKLLDDGTSHGWDISDMDEGLRQEMKRTGEKRDIWFTVHAPWQANPLKAGGNELLIESLEFAKDIGARLVNLHLYMDLGATGYVEALGPVIDYAAQVGVQLSIENTPLTTADDVNRTFAVLHKSGADHVGFCLDIGHANLCTPTRNDFIRYMDQLDPHVPLIHTHVHENYGDQDSHLTLFTGPAADNDGGIRAFISRLKDRQYQGAAILEQWPQPPELLIQAEQRLRKIIGKEKSRHSSAHAERQQQETTASREPEQGLKPKPAIDTPVDTKDAPAPSDPFAAAVAQAHMSHNSWRERLGWVAERLASNEQNLDIGALTTLAVYLRFVGTGEAACAEDGRHFRPNHHARSAQAIEQALAELETQDNAWVLRKIYPWLPSYSDQFQHREPLTRIRDIAHRNDIPKELKHEIKHRLQNKLHRCAGPEDLKTSEEILQRITASGANYSPDFVEQFQIFHKELTEFFNAATLESRLEELAATAGKADKKQIHTFLQMKRQKPRSEIRLLKLIEALTALRSALSQHAQAHVDAEAQRLRLTDIALEEYAFMLLSDYANRLEGFAAKDAWEKLFRVLKAALTNIHMSRIDQQECTVLLSELRAWSEDFSATNPFQLRRLMATLERMRRLAEAYTDRVLDLFPTRVQQLGRALGVQAHAIQIFCEGDIRGNLVFQLSKLADMARCAVRAALELSPWEILVPGEAKGRLVGIKDLQMVNQASGPLIALLERAEGDEEIPDQVGAIILRHPIPHLSHLGVRARQRRLPFVTSDDAQTLAPLEQLLDQPVRLRVTAETVAVEPADSVHEYHAQTVQAVAVPQAELTREIRFLPLSEARAARCGAKAAGAQRLLEMAGDSSGGAFKALQGQILPFGVMEQCLANNPELEQRYEDLLQALERDDAGNSVIDSLRALVLSIPVPANLLQEIRTFFGGNTRLAVRSSANGEDLEKFAGAGLYDSVIGVTAAQCGPAIQAVWASLWTQRAAMSRIQAGIRHKDLHMALLVQEMVEPDLSFIMHTTDPATGNQDLALVELAVGLGETLASACQPGTPYRLQCNRISGETDLIRHASFSFALRAGGSQPDIKPDIKKDPLDYAQIPLSNDPDAGRRLGRHFAVIASFLEERLGRAQDVEGVIVGNEIYLVQTRTQQGL